MSNDDETVERISPELIAQLNKLASYLTAQGEYEAVDLIDTVVERVSAMPEREMLPRGAGGADRMRRGARKQLSGCGLSRERKIATGRSISTRPRSRRQNPGGDGAAAEGGGAVSNPWVVHSAAESLTPDVRRWVLRGGAVPDAVWFGKWSHLKRMNEDGSWRRTEFCERLAEYLRGADLRGHDVNRD